MTTLIGHPPIFWSLIRERNDIVFDNLARRFHNEDVIDQAEGGLRMYDRQLRQKPNYPAIFFGKAYGKAYTLNKHSDDL